MSYTFEHLEHEKNKFSWNFHLAKVCITAPPKTPLGDDWKPNYCILPEKHLKFIEEIKKFDIRKDDVWMVAFPKCGITWAQEMVWLISHNFDYDTANSVKLKVRCPFFELSSLNTDEMDHKELKAMMDIVDERVSPRNIKTHLPLAFLPDDLWTVKPKIVYVCRDPKDVAVSYYIQYKNLHGYQGSLREFMDLFLEGLVAYTPFESHVNEFWKLRDQNNILFLTYEEMHADLKQAICKTAKFFDKDLSMEDIELLYDHLQPETMRKNQACNQDDMMNRMSPRWSNIEPDYEIIRKAQVGSYKDEMPIEYVEHFNKFINDKITPVSGLYKCCSKDKCCSKGICCSKDTCDC